MMRLVHSWRESGLNISIVYMYRTMPRKSIQVRPENVKKQKLRQLTQGQKSQLERMTPAQQKRYIERAVGGKPKFQESKTDSIVF